MCVLCIVVCLCVCVCVILFSRFYHARQSQELEQTNGTLMAVRNGIFIHFFFALSLSHTLLAYIEMEIVLLLLWSITTNQNNTHLVFGRIYRRVCVWVVCARPFNCSNCILDSSKHCVQRKLISNSECGYYLKLF